GGESGERRAGGGGRGVADGGGRNRGPADDAECGARLEAAAAHHGAVVDAHLFHLRRVVGARRPGLDVGAAVQPGVRLDDEVRIGRAAQEPLAGHRAVGDERDEEQEGGRPHRPHLGPSRRYAVTSGTPSSVSTWAGRSVWKASQIMYSYLLKCFSCTTSATSEARIAGSSRPGSRMSRRRRPSRRYMT